VRPSVNPRTETEKCSETQSWRFASSADERSSDRIALCYSNYRHGTRKFRSRDNRLHPAACTYSSSDLSDRPSAAILQEKQ